MANNKPNKGPMQVTEKAKDLKTSLKRFIPTYASNALKGSSKINISESLYIALAIANLAFCPPDKFTPFSPISVWSPKGNINKSGSN